MRRVMAWNVFKFCTTLRALGSIMILVVLAIIGVTYYSVVVVNYGPALFHGGRDTVVSLAVLLLFHFLLAMLLWSYFSVVLTDPGGIPRNWRPPMDEERGDTDPLVGAQDGPIGADSNQFPMPGDAADQKTKLCRKCNQFKPPRCHHCSVCGRCILKMDHPACGLSIVLGP